MKTIHDIDSKPLGRYVGWSLLGMIAVGILSSVFLAHGIDVNLTADPAGTAANMLQAETRLRAKAYIAVLGFGLEVFISVGLFFLLRSHGALLATWSLVAGVTAALLSLLGAVFAMNAAEIAGNPAYRVLTDDAQRLMLAGLQATSDYTSFHLSLVLSSIAKAGFFYLFLKSSLIPKLIAGWGVFASVFVATTIVGRDFVPILASQPVTVAFLASNLIALVALGAYLGIWGVRNESSR